MARTRAGTSPSGWCPRGDGRCRRARDLPGYSHCLCAGPDVSVCALSHGGERHGTGLGISWRASPVVLKRAGRVVATKTAQVTADVFEQQVQFEIEPEEVGEFTYTVSVAPHLGEALTENNQADFPLSVARDKIRVLLVCGSPTWNYRFLRQGLKQDPSIDMISFVILRTPTDVVNVPESQLSLIPFPTQRLFTQELKNFDLIIFENFSYQLYFPWYYLENVRKYVQEGGAFAMIGGMLAFSQGVRGTPIEEILPVALRPDRNDYRTVTQRLVLTEEGKAHPITRLSPDATENQRIWDMLPELDAFNLVGQVKPGATVLGISSGRLDDRPAVPLLAMQRFGEGRTLALMSDYIWKWNFQMAGRLDSNQYYLQFVRQMVRWLIRDPILKQVRIMADASEFPVGSEVTGTLQVLQDDYRPTENATLSTKLRTPHGTETPVQYVPTGNPGEYRYRFRADEEGIYELDVQADIGGKTHEANRLLLRVQRPGDESQHAAPNHKLLRDIAERTGGTFFPIYAPARPSVASLIEFFGGAPSYKVLEETQLRLRETLPLFLAVLGVLGSSGGGGGGPACSKVDAGWRVQARHRHAQVTTATPTIHSRQVVLSANQVLPKSGPLPLAGCDGRENLDARRHLRTNSRCPRGAPPSPPGGALRTL